MHSIDQISTAFVYSETFNIGRFFILRKKNQGIMMDDRI